MWQVGCEEIRFQLAKGSVGVGSRASDGLIACESGWVCMISPIQLSQPTTQRMGPLLAQSSRAHTLPAWYLRKEVAGNELGEEVLQRLSLILH